MTGPFYETEIYETDVEFTDSSAETSGNPSRPSKIDQIISVVATAGLALSLTLLSSTRPMVTNQAYASTLCIAGPQADLRARFAPESVDPSLYRPAVGERVRAQRRVLAQTRPGVIAPFLDDVTGE